MEDVCVGFLYDEELEVLE